MLLQDIIFFRGFLKKRGEFIKELPITIEFKILFRTFKTNLVF